LKYVSIQLKGLLCYCYSLINLLYVNKIFRFSRCYVHCMYVLYCTLYINIGIIILLIILRHGFYIKHNVAETRLCLRLRVEPAQLSPTKYVLPEDGERTQCPKRCYMKKAFAMDNVQNCDSHFL
jgi:hypothetical protein